MKAVMLVGGFDNTRLRRSPQTTCVPKLAGSSAWPIACSKRTAADRCPGNAHLTPTPNVT